MSRSYWIMLGGYGVSVALLIPSADGTTNGSYYLLKTAWVPVGLLLSLAVPALAVAVWRSEARVRVIASALAAAGIFLTQPAGLARTYHVLTGASGMPAITIPLFDHFKPRTSAGEAVTYLTWGLMPYLAADTQSVVQSLNVDVAAIGTLPNAGYGIPHGLGPPGSVRYWDASSTCDMLTRHPDAVVITGPFQEGPLQLLRDSKCPESSIRPERWVSIDLDRELFAGTRWEEAAYGSPFASWSDVQRILSDLRQSSARPATSSSPG